MQICSKNEITIRALVNNNEDFIDLYRWLNNENVYEHYGDSCEKNFEYVKQKYENKINEENMYPCIIEYNNKSIGYIQFYSVNSGNYNLSSEQLNLITKENDKIFGIDIFIGEDEYRDKGIGTKTLKLLIYTLFEKYFADVILIDPKVINPRAISCYKKCGFQECFIVKEREEKDGIKYDNLIMKIEKNC